MALKSTVYKCELQIANMDTAYYDSHSLTMACHPSENEQRLMLRLLAFGLNASEDMVFCKGLSSDDEPDLWRKSLSDEILHWIDLGQPEEKRIRKACGRSLQVSIYAYQPRSTRIWWSQQAAGLERFKNLSVYLISEDQSQQLAELASRSMELQLTVQDDQVWLTDGNINVSPIVECLKEASM